MEPDGLAHLRGHPAIAQASRSAYDAALAGRLWDLSARLTGIASPVAVPAGAGS